MQINPKASPVLGGGPGRSGLTGGAGVSPKQTHIGHPFSDPAWKLIREFLAHLHMGQDTLARGPQVHV